jgi:hypothetical protein
MLFMLSVFWANEMQAMLQKKKDKNETFFSIPENT